MALLAALSGDREWHVPWGQCPSRPVLRFTLFREGLLTAHCSLLIAHCSTLIALYPTQPQDSTAARAPGGSGRLRKPHPPAMGVAHTVRLPPPAALLSQQPRAGGSPHCLLASRGPKRLVPQELACRHSTPCRNGTGTGRKQRKQ